MSSATLKVLKWSALGGGIVYGFAHNRTLASKAETKRFNEEWTRKENLIKEAKEKFAEQQAAKAPKGEVITDVSDPKFDLEKLIDHALKE